MFNVLALQDLPALVTLGAEPIDDPGAGQPTCTACTSTCPYTLS